MRTRLLPGLLLCSLVTVAAIGLEHAEALLFGRAWLESLVLAILLGCAVRTLVRLGPRWDAGIQFGAKNLLELAVLLLGASVSAGAILEKGCVQGGEGTVLTGCNSTEMPFDQVRIFQ